MVTPAGVSTGNHGVLALGLLDNIGLRTPRWYRAWRTKNPDVYDPQVQWEKAVSEVTESPCPMAVISSEFFIGFGRGPRAKQCIDTVHAFLEPFDVRIVCYLRRPDNMIESFYNQVIKTGDAVQRLYGDVSRYRDKPVLDYVRALSPWVDRFGREHVIVRNYDRLIDGDLVADFFSIIGKSEASALGGIEGTRNPRIPNALVELKRFCNVLQNSPRQEQQINHALSILADSVDLVPDRLVSTLSENDRRFLYQHTMDLNERLQSLLGDAAEQPFFEDPDSILKSEGEAVTDLQAAERYAGLLSLLITVQAYDGPPASSKATHSPNERQSKEILVEKDQYWGLS